MHVQRVFRLFSFRTRRALQQHAMIHKDEYPITKIGVSTDLWWSMWMCGCWMSLRLSSLNKSNVNCCSKCFLKQSTKCDRCVDYNKLKLCVFLSCSVALQTLQTIWIKPHFRREIDPRSSKYPTADFFLFIELHKYRYEGISRHHL